MCDPPSGCKEMRPSSFPDPEQAGAEARPVHSLPLPAVQSGNLQSDNKPPETLAVHHRMTHDRAFSERCFGSETPICFHILSALKGFVTMLCYFLRFMSSKPPFWLLQRNAVWWYRMITRRQYVLVCFAFCSTPARSCSEELFHHSTTLAANAALLVATSPVATSGKHPPVTEREEEAVRKGGDGAPLVADAERDQTLSLTSPKHVTIPSPSHFLPVPATVATTPAATTDTGRRKGRARSESEDPHGGASWLDSSLPATWAPSSNYTTCYEFPPCWSRTT